jgi:hypothetical protein
MDFLTILASIVGAINALALAVFGHVYRTIAQERKERLKLAEDVNTFRVEVPRDYVAKAEFVRGIDEVKLSLQRIYDLLISGRHRE